MSSPTADDTLHPSPQPRCPRPKRHIPYIDGTGEVEEPTYNRNSVVEEPEELEPDSTEPTPHVARNSFFSHSRSPSSHRTARTWRRVCKASSLAIVSLRTFPRQQRFAPNRIVPIDDDSSSDGSSYGMVPVRTKKGLKPWRKFVQKLKNYDERMVKGWKEDIDTLLVFVSSCAICFTLPKLSILRLVYSRLC